MAFTLAPQISELENGKRYDISTIFPLNEHGTCVLIIKHKRSVGGIELEVQTDSDQSYDESFSGGSTQVEVKVSVDDGETWARRMINNGGELDDSGLEAGEIVQLQGTNFRILAGDDGLRIELIRKPVGEKKQARRR